ncbi:hypothetical protein CIL05_14045 [Virgibacillus profundi]|uniref:Uncharacterized protein n=1 Tax=Virgibacillus profundi TaxID=2024555 RepID=A0A2A2IAS2_9BACI|nr:SA1362 family protein [Virgibacillus profundi]PAV29091.1 hypothetical protein CIL05_14045 [Virgibacillus profundi]PXY53260.1 hypothetical protein CIT14_14170 [Virgibacillus profundi]
MARKKVSLLIYIIIGLALVGLVTQLFTNTANFITNLFVMIGIGVAIFAVIYFVFLRNRAPSNDMTKYKKAVKQSKAKYKNPKATSQSYNAAAKKSKPVPPKKKVSKRASHLRVIDGNKTKRKDRASL